MSKIIALVVNNFKRIKAIEIEPGAESVIQIRGKNGQGKSSCLDAIAAALGGERLCPTIPIRRGENGAVVRVELDDDLVIERRWSAGGGSTLKVTTKEGVSVKKPQARLDGIMGKLSFDPLSFMSLEPKKQAETLRSLAGVDFSVLDGRREQAYVARTDANRQVMQIRTRLAAIPEIEAPDEIESAAELMAEQQRRVDQRSANERRQMELDTVRGKFRQAGEEVDQREAAIADLEDQLQEARILLGNSLARREELRAQGTTLKAEVDQLVDPDLLEIPAKLREIESTNERVRAKKARRELAKELTQAELKAKELDDEIAYIDTTKAAKLAAVKFPVEGLAFTDDGVTFGGLPFEQSSQSEQLRISVAIGSALNPKLRTMLVRDGSRLDNESLALLRDEASRSGMQVWLEQIGKDGDGFVIEDGQVEEPGSDG